MNYIESSINVIANEIAEKQIRNMKINTEDKNQAENMETLLRKLEGEIREHIAVRNIIINNS